MRLQTQGHQSKQQPTAIMAHPLCSICSPLPPPAQAKIRPSWGLHQAALAGSQAAPAKQGLLASLAMCITV